MFKSIVETFLLAFLSIKKQMEIIIEYNFKDINFYKKWSQGIRQRKEFQCFFLGI